MGSAEPAMAQPLCVGLKFYHYTFNLAHPSPHIQLYKQIIVAFYVRQWCLHVYRYFISFRFRNSSRILSSDYAQPAVAVYSACNLLLSLSLRLLLISCMRPVSLAKDEPHARTLVAMKFGQKISTPVSIAAIILSFWFPHIAFYTITLFWGYVVLRTFWLQKQFGK